jgi:4-hydroxy 2-oxovalerate aldolase
MVRLLDVTLRDGGYVNGFSFSVEESCQVARLLREAGIPIVEIGYFIPGRTTPDDLGRKGYTLDHLSEVAACCQPEMKPVVMIPPGVAARGDYLALAQLGIKGVRFPAPPAKFDLLIPDVEAARNAGLLVFLNLIRVSEYSMKELLNLCGRLALMNPDWLYLADSNGGLFPHQVREIVRALRREIDVPLGFHPHNGLSLAFANSLAAMDEGISILDGSLGGLGKGGGNLSLEMMALFLNSRQETFFSFRPLLQASRNSLMPWLGEAWPKRLQDILSSITNLDLQMVISLKQQFGNDPWNLLEALVQCFEQKYCRLEATA